MPKTKNQKRQTALKNLKESLTVGQYRNPLNPNRKRVKNEIKHLETILSNNGG